MNLPTKQRAKINAALCLIHDSGHNADAVSGVARDMIRAGTEPRAAYERALNSFAANHPDLLPSLARVVKLVEASDDATVAQYDAALSSYIATGDNTGITALAPTIARDMGELATRNGEEAPAFSPEFQQMAAEPSATSTFAFEGQGAPEAVAGRPVVGHGPSGAIVRTVSQVSAAPNPTGMVAPRAATAWASAPYVGPVSATPAPHGLGAKDAREAARAAAATGGRAIIADGGE